MHAACLSLVIATCFASATGFSLLDGLIDYPELVDIHRKNSLLPCFCTNGSVDCSERGMSSLDTEDLCPGTVTRINLYDNEFAVVPDGIRDAIVVNMSYNRLKTMPQSSQLSPRVEVLDLSGNQISDSNDELLPLVFLEVLIVSENYELRSLKFLPDPCALRHLKASHINLRNLTDSLLQCTMLEVLDLSRNDLSALPGDTFSTLRRLHSLNLAGNNLEPLPAGLFDPLTELRRLSLQFCGIYSLPDKILEPLSKLEQLNLRGNLFKTLPNEFFSTQSNLLILDLTKIPFTTYPAALKEISSLEVLNLALSPITSLPNNAFDFQPRLKEINLLYNNISYIPTNIFSGLTNLHTVTMTKNPLRSLQEGLFSESPNLKTVWLPCVDDYRKNLRVLENVSNILIGPCGRIELSPSIFSAVPRAELIMINENTITWISQKAFVGLPFLHTLDLSENGLSDLPSKVFSPLPQLQRLHLFNNRLTQIPKGLFSGLRNLTSLSLSNNRLLELQENTFQDLVSLERIDLSINQLKSVPPNLFAGLQFLREVSFGNNLLSTLPPYNPSWASVRAVSFSYNNISLLDPETLRPWLDAGDDDRQLNIMLREDRGNGPSPKTLTWLLFESNILIKSCGFRRCNCGLIRRGGVLVELAAVIRCEKDPALKEDWFTEIVRADQPETYL